MPLMASYALARCKRRKPRRLDKRLPGMVEALMVEALRAEYRKTEMYARDWGRPDKAAAHVGAKPKSKKKRAAPKRTRS